MHKPSINCFKESIRLNWDKICQKIDYSDLESNTTASIQNLTFILFLENLGFILKVKISVILLEQSCELNLNCQQGPSKECDWSFGKNRVLIGYTQKWSQDLRGWKC